MTVTDWPTASLTAFRLCSALHSLDAKYAGCGQNESQTVTGYASKPASHVVPRVRKPAGERLRGEGRMVGGRCSPFHVIVFAENSPNAAFDLAGPSATPATIVVTHRPSRLQKPP